MINKKNTNLYFSLVLGEILVITPWLLVIQKKIGGELFQYIKNDLLNAFLLFTIPIVLLPIITIYIIHKNTSSQKHFLTAISIIHLIVVFTVFGIYANF